ncbi:MAG: hypothetical protein JSS21_00185, partial [Proteobacteria bacterium]|nr:hypothetical protein [Pseudomonadota bacterium]
MKILTACVCSALALPAVTSAYAADANKAVVTRDWSDTVAPADQQAYEDGVKAYNRCLHDNGVKYDEDAYVHETGDTYKYSYVIGPYTWADFDTLRTQSKPCDAVWRTQANPHLKGETSAFMVDQPEMSHMPADWVRGKLRPPLIHVLYFTLNPGHAADEAFTSVLKKAAAAADKAKWPFYYRVLAVQGGDDGSPDYLIVIPHNLWKDYGADPNPTFWKMVANAY